jgi:hypothetical protein
MDLAASGRAELAAPLELGGPLPRTVMLNLDGDARYLLIIVLLFFVGGGIWLGWKGYDDVLQFKNGALLRSNGRNVVGEVTGFSRPSHGPTSVHYKFAFDGVNYFGAAEEPEAKPETSLNKADKIFVRFLPSNPAVNHPCAWEWSLATGWVWVAFQVFFWGVGGIALVFLCRDRTLARKGNVATGIVTNCVPTDRSFHIEYEFRTADGTPMKGNTDRKEQHERGTRVWILYMPQRPRRNDLYPLLLFDVLG